MTFATSKQGKESGGIPSPDGNRGTVGFLKFFASKQASASPGRHDSPRWSESTGFLLSEAFQVSMINSISYAVAAGLDNTRFKPTQVTTDLTSFVSQFHPQQYEIASNKRGLPVWLPAILREPDRTDSQVEAMTALVIDLDQGTSEDLSRQIAEWDHRDLDYLVHSSYSYEPPFKAKARAVFFLARPVPIAHRFMWRDVFYPALVAHVGATAEADPACRNVSRCYFVPAKPSHDAPTLFHRHEGLPIDADEVLDGMLSADAAADYDLTCDFDPGELEDPSCAVDVEDLSSRLLLRCRGKRTAPAVRMMLECLVPPVSRHDVIRDAMAGLALVAEDEEPTQGLFRIAEPWLEAFTASFGHRDGPESWKGEALRALRDARHRKLNEWEPARTRQLLEIAAALDAHHGEAR